MAHAISPVALLRQADQLGYRDAGRGRPSNASLRRAVSAAYYALFHWIGLATARHLLSDSPGADQYRVARSVSHEAVRRVCTWVMGSSAPEHVAPIARSITDRSPDLRGAAETVLDLQDARHEADYDHLASFTKERTLNLVDAARDAIAKLEALPAPIRQSFLSLVALATAVR